jgi:hypothetical protein
MAAPLERAGLVGALSRITHEMFARLDGTAARLDIVFTRPDPMASRRLGRPAHRSSAGDLKPLGARLG